MNRKTIKLLILISSVLGLLLFWDVDVSQQVGLLNGLIAVAAVVFGILGVLVSVLDPVAILEKKPGQPSNPRSRLARRFMPVWIQATYAFAAVIAARLLLPTVPNILQTLELLVAWTLSIDLGGLLSQTLGQATSALLQALLQASAGALICFLYLIEIVILLFSLLPVATADTEERAETYEDAVAKDAAQLEHHDK